MGVTAAAIGGFAAVETQSPYLRTTSHCIVAVDVAAGQNLWVQYEYDGATLPMTRELACDKARAAAEMAVQTLAEHAGG